MTKTSVTMYFKEGSSDKVYQASIDEAKDGFLVNFAYGRRGSSMSTGTKTTKPVSIEEATKIYEKLVKEKTAKGYKPGEDGAAYGNSVAAIAVATRDERDTGLRPQLLNEVEEDQVENLISNHDYWMQEKHDGRRSLLKKDEQSIIGTNRMGLAISLADRILENASERSSDFILDGELVGEALFVFDLLSLGGRDLRDMTYSHRLSQLEALGYGGSRWANRTNGSICIVETAKTTKEKRELYERLKRENREGVVFKRHDAKYTAGRPNSGGSQLKFKFYATLSALVAEGRKGKRSVALELLDGPRLPMPAGHWIPIGNVTVPANQPIPKPGQVVEVRYLYAYPGGSLYQPTLLGIRDDVDSKACLASQLKFKATDQDDDA